MAMVTVAGETYHIDDKTKAKWDKIKDGQLAKLDEDRVYVVDGRERSGKSVWTLQQACYIDPSLVNDLDRITITPEETLNAIRKTNSTDTETKVIISDEAFRGMSSRAVLSKVNKMITQALMEMGQKNLVLFIVLPSFFLLDMYCAVLRSNALIHISKKKGTNQRSFKVYSYKKKAVLYETGLKKGWNYKIYTPIMGRFPNKYPGGKAFEMKYRKKKLSALETMGIEARFDKKEGRIHQERKILAYLLIEQLCKTYNWTQQQALDWLKERNIVYDQSNYSKMKAFAWENGNLKVKGKGKYNKFNVEEEE